MMLAFDGFTKSKTKSLTLCYSVLHQEIFKRVTITHEYGYGELVLMFTGFISCSYLCYHFILHCIVLLTSKSTFLTKMSVGFIAPWNLIMPY